MDLNDGGRKRPLSINTKRSSDEAEKREGGGMCNGELTAAEEEEPLSPAARLFHQPHFNCNIITLMGTGKRIDVDAVKAGLEASLVRHPRFSSILVSKGIGKLRWVRTNVAVENHLVVPDLDSEAIDSPDKFVEDYAAALSKTTLDQSRPLWDLHILNLRTSDAEAVAVFRVHHSLGDGTSLMSLLLACTRKTSDPDSLPTLPETGRRAPAAGNRCSGLWAVAEWVWAALVLLLNTVVGLLLFTATVAFLNDTETPLKGAEGVEFNPKRFVRRTLSLDDIKFVKNAVGSTVNDVLLGISSAGLSRYLSRSRDGEDDKGKKKRLSKKTRLRSTVLVNIRPTPGIHALADMMEKEGKGSAKWGNCFAYVIVPFAIATYKDPLDYVRKAKAITDRKKNSLEAILTFNTASLVVKIFGIKAAALLCHRVLRHTTLSFSNLIGPVEEIGFYGHPLVYLAPSVYGHANALTLHFQSYTNKMEMVLAVDELAIPDPGRLCDDLAESLRLIKDAVSAS